MPRSVDPVLEPGTQFGGDRRRAPLPPRRAPRPRPGPTHGPRWTRRRPRQAWRAAFAPGRPRRQRPLRERDRVVDADQDHGGPSVPSSNSPDRHVPVVALITLAVRGLARGTRQQFMSAVSGAQQPLEAARLNWDATGRARDVDLASFRDVVGPEGCADGDGRRPPRRGRADGLGGIAAAAHRHRPRTAAATIRTVSASFRASHGFPLRFREGYCSCAVGTNCVHVAALVLAATDETLLPATAQAGAPTARRSTLPWEQSLDSLLATPQTGGHRAPTRTPVPRSAPLAVELSLVPNTPEPAATPATPPTTAGRSRRRRRHPQAQAPGPAGAAAAASAAGWPAT